MDIRPIEAEEDYNRHLAEIGQYFDDEPAPASQEAARLSPALHTAFPACLSSYDFFTPGVRVPLERCLGRVLGILLVGSISARKVISILSISPV